VLGWLQAEENTEQSRADANYRTDLLPLSLSVLGVLSLQPGSSRETTVQSWTKKGGT